MLSLLNHWLRPETQVITQGWLRVISHFQRYVNIQLGCRNGRRRQGIRVNGLGRLLERIELLHVQLHHTFLVIEFVVNGALSLVLFIFVIGVAGFLCVQHPESFAALFVQEIELGLISYEVHVAQFECLLVISFLVIIQPLYQIEIIHLWHLMVLFTNLFAILGHPLGAVLVLLLPHLLLLALEVSGNSELGLRGARVCVGFGVEVLPILIRINANSLDGRGRIVRTGSVAGCVAST